MTALTTIQKEEIALSIGSYIREIPLKSLEGIDTLVALLEGKLDESKVPESLLWLNEYLRYLHRINLDVKDFNQYVGQVITTEINLLKEKKIKGDLVFRILRKLKKQKQNLLYKRSLIHTFLKQILPNFVALIFLRTFLIEILMTPLEIQKM